MDQLGGQDSHAGTLSVLVVDDEPEIADLIATYLERVDEDLSVTQVADPDDGLERLRGGDYDGVVSDYHMPTMDGLSFLDTVAEEAPSAARILYTSDDADHVIREADDADVEFVHKRMCREHHERIADLIKSHEGVRAR